MKTKFFEVIFLSCLVVFNLQSQVLRTFTGHERPVRSLAFSPDGLTLASGANDNLIKLWNLTTGENSLNLQQLNPSNAVVSLSFRSDGAYLASAVFGFNNQNQTTINELKYWAISKGRFMPFQHTHTDKINQVIFSPDGNYMATCSDDELIKIWEYSTTKEVASFKGHDGAVNSIAYSGDGKIIISGGKDKTIRLWDVATATEINSFKGHTSAVTSVAITADGKYIGSGSKDKTVRVWDVEKGQQLWLGKGHTDIVTAVAITSDGRYLASASDDKTLKIWEMETGRTIPTFIGAGHQKEVTCLAFSSDGKLATGSEDKTVKLWKWEFPILTMTPAELDDANKNKQLDGLEEASITFTIINKGYGEAQNVKIAISEKNNAEGLEYPKTIEVGKLQGKEKKLIRIPIKGTKQIKNNKTDFSIQLTDANFSVIAPISISFETFGIPILNVFDAKIADSNNDKIIDGVEEAKLTFTIENEGMGDAYFIKASVIEKNKLAGITFPSEFEIGNIPMKSKKSVEIPIKGSKKIAAGTATFVVSFTEQNNAALNPIEASITTKPPIVTTKDLLKEYVETKINEWQNKGKFEKTEDFLKRVNVETRAKRVELLTQQAIDTFALRSLNWSNVTVEYDADNESFKITFANFLPVFLKVPISQAEYFDKNFKNFRFKNSKYTIANEQLAFLHIEMNDTIAKNTYTYDSKDQIAFNSSLLDINFSPIDITLTNDATAVGNISDTKKVIKVGKSDVDENIPENADIKKNVYALIIGNEDYKSSQPDLNSEINVDFAVNDAEIFKEYVVKTLGVPVKQVKLLLNATLGQMNQGIAWISNLSKIEAGKAELIIYFAGHGLPDDASKEPYLIPVDISGTNVTSGIKLAELYRKITENPAQKITVFLDACFSGGGRNAGLVAMRGVKVKPKDESFSSDMVVFASSSGDESSAVFREKMHGYFTYFLLKKLQETKGDITYKDFTDYVIESVKKETALISKNQNPRVSVSPNAIEKWETWKMK
jgi:WD40 repeat protein